MLASILKNAITHLSEEPVAEPESEFPSAAFFVNPGFLAGHQSTPLLRAGNYLTACLSTGNISSKLHSCQQAFTYEIAHTEFINECTHEKFYQQMSQN